MPRCPFLTDPSASAIPRVPDHWTFPSHPASVRQARHAVTAALPTTFPVDLRDELALLTSELVTNAIRHGSQPDDGDVIELVLWPADGHYWLAVSDSGDALPSVAAPDSDACGGRGLFLVDAVSATWAVVALPTHGKSVVAGIRLRRE